MWTLVNFIYREYCRARLVEMRQLTDELEELETAKYTYLDFEIETFEIGPNQWHVRFRRNDDQPIVMDGMSFATSDVGLSWPTLDAALADACQHIDRMGGRSGSTPLAF